MARRKRKGKIGVEQLHSGKFMWRITVGSKDGKQIRKAGTCDTELEAVKARAQAIADTKNGRMVMPYKRTFGGFLAAWHATQKPHIAGSTFHNYDTLIRCFILEGLKAKKLQDLKKSDFDGLNAHLVAEGYALGTRQRVMRLVKRALFTAVDEELIFKNPAQTVRVRGSVEELTEDTDKALTAEEMLKFLAVARGHHLFGLFYTLFSLGLRNGEALGVRWSDIDFKAGTIRVVQQAKVDVSKIEVGALKTAGSKRKLYMSDDLRAVLIEHKAQQDADKARVGTKWADDTGLVFTTRIGTIPYLGNTNRTIWRLCDLAGIRRFSTHGGRYTMTSLMMMNGAKAEVVAAILGHKSSTITRKHYRTVYDEEKRDVFSVAATDAATQTARHEA